MTVTPVRTVELTDALAALHGPEADDLAGRVAWTFRLVARGELNPDDLLVARRDGRLVGAVFAQSLPGGTGVIWPPRAVPDDTQAEDALMAAALEHLAGVKVVQAFLGPAEADRPPVLLRHDFRHVTRIIEMVRTNAAKDPKALDASRTKPSNVTIAPYAEVDPEVFLRTLVRAHVDSLDCPELHDIRDPEEVLAGYQDCAPDASRWRLARVGQEPAGVLILSDQELIFAGVTPEWRGQGVGRALIEHACRQCPGLRLIVDARNEPAYQLYRSLGFEGTGWREVFLWFPCPS